MKFFSNAIVIVKQSLAYLLAAVFFMIIYEVFLFRIFKIPSENPLIALINNIFLLFFTIIFFYKNRQDFSDRLFKQRIQIKRFIYVTLFGVFARLPILILFLIFIAFSGDQIVDLLNEGVEMQWEGVNNLTGLDYFLNIFSTAVIIPLHEEIFFRGVVFLTLLKTMSPKGAIIVSSIVFALFHFHPGLYLITFLLGVMMAYVFYKFGNIWYSVWFHVLLNLQPFIFSYFEML